MAIERPFWQRIEFLRAGVAQLVEHLICNQRVGGSNPFASSKCQIVCGPDRSKLIARWRQD